MGFLPGSSKQPDSNEVLKVDQKSADIAKKLGLPDRMERFTEQCAFLTIKDHKCNFGPGSVSCRLINPAKTDIGRIAKHLLQRINEEVRTGTNLNQWRSTQDTLKWFKGLRIGRTTTFIKFDIEAYYPNIKQEV